MDLYQEAYKANQEVMEAKGLTSVRNGSYLGVDWEVFLYERDINDYGDGFIYIGSLSSPTMWGYDLSSEFNPKFKAWFLERIKAYGVVRGWSGRSLGNLCYRQKQPFGSTPELHQMTFPFKE